MIRFRTFLDEDYKTARKIFLTKDQELKVADMDATIELFKKIQNRLTGDEKNIDYWAKQGFAAFAKFVGRKILGLSFQDKDDIDKFAEWVKEVRES